MNILDKIVAQKKVEVQARKAKTKTAQLEKSKFFSRAALSLRDALRDESKTHIIAEFKRKSPSKGVINDKVDAVTITQAYTDLGAAGLSILTDEHFFGGSNQDIVECRIHNIPILRKDFVVDPYQVIEARAIGADAVLLIAACLTPQQVRDLARVAKSLQLEVLLEIHDDQELGHICDEVDLVGVNNRDLKTFSVDIRRSEELSRLLPAEKIKITESGIVHANTIGHLRSFGFMGFLIGELFMKESNPAIAFASFVNELKKGPHESKSLRHDTTRSGQEAG
jgi:indole-3-glycerol phosphate synthase